MTLFSRLFRLFLFVIITPLFITGVFLFYYQNHSKNEILEHLLTTAQISDRFVKQTVENITLRFDFVNDIAPELNKNKKQVQNLLDDTIKTNPDFAFLAILDENGREIIRSANADISSGIAKLDLSGDPSLKKLTLQNVAISSFDKSQGVMPYVEMLYPVNDGKYLFAIVNLYSILEKLTAQNIGNTGGIYLASQDGDIITFDNRPVPQILPQALFNSFDPKTGFIKTVADEYGDKYIGAYTPASIPNMYVLALQYKKEAFYTLNLITWLIVFFILATTTLSYFAALSFSQEASEPLEKITEAALKISENDFNVQINSSNAWGEFEILINAFNLMASRLDGYQAMQLDKILDEKRKVDLLTSLMKDGVIMCTLEGRLLYANTTANKILNSAGLETTLSGSVKEPSLKNFLALPSGATFSCQIEDKAAHFEMLTEIFRPAKEEPVAIIILRDITAEYEIDELKNDIFNSVAHDLRAPLLGLQAYIMIMQEGGLTKEQEKQMLASMERSSHTLTGLIENILDVSKLSRGLLEINKTSFNLVSLVEEIINTLKPLAESKKLYLRSQINDTITLQADKTLIGRALANLISNAIKFTEQGGIEVSYKLEGNMHAITVADTGVGIKAQALPKIFDKYYKGDNGAKGYGLGLTITRQIILAHGGDISAKSEYGHGSQITFTLPKEVKI
ncbi:MAG: HAMP domain-containing protein [Elusimicrobiota bacterium]|jgi:signal transduction histidine kinase|nr:HAMP domain-containing protein [Elusimicrobiota bacterium]